MTIQTPPTTDTEIVRARPSRGQRVAAAAVHALGPRPLPRREDFVVSALVMAALAVVVFVLRFGGVR